MINTEVIARIIRDIMTPAQIEQFIERNSDALDEGKCPICGEEEVAVDGNGTLLEDIDINEASSWQERHTPRCLIPYLEQYVAPAKMEYHEEEEEEDNDEEEVVEGDGEEFITESITISQFFQDLFFPWHTPTI